MLLLSASVLSNHAAKLSAAGILLMIFAFSLCVALGLVAVANSVSIIGYPESTREVEILQELSARLFLLLSASLISALLLSNRPAEDRFIGQPWQVIALILAWLGLLFAVGDPSNHIAHEGNLIRYWTFAMLISAGLIGLWHGLKRNELMLARLVGLGLGGLLILAAIDELFQWHEKVGSEVRLDWHPAWLIDQQDIPTLVAALIGVVGFSLVLVLYRWAPRAFAQLRSPRFKRPMMLLGLAVIMFAIAMALDSFDRHLVTLAEISGLPDSYETILPEAPFWHYLLNLGVIANSLEEILEFVSAICLLMTMASLFSIGFLGFQETEDSSVE